MRSRALNFCQQRGDVEFHGALGEIQVRADLLVRFMPQQALEHLAFAPGEPRAVADCCLGWPREVPARAGQSNPVSRRSARPARCSRRASAPAPRNASPEARRPIRPARLRQAWPARESASHPRRAHKKQTLLAARSRGSPEAAFNRVLFLDLFRVTLAIDDFQSVRGGERKVRLYEDLRRNECRM